MVHLLLVFNLASKVLNVSLKKYLDEWSIERSMVLNTHSTPVHYLELICSFGFLTNLKEGNEKSKEKPDIDHLNVRCLWQRHRHIDEPGGSQVLSFYIEGVFY